MRRILPIQQESGGWGWNKEVIQASKGNRLSHVTKSTQVDQEQIQHSIASDSSLALIDYIENNGPTQEIRQVAGRHIFGQPTTPKFKSNFLWNLLDTIGVWMKPESLHGDQAVSRDLRSRSSAAAIVLSGSSLIDYISSLGLFAFIFALAPGGPIPYTLALSSLLLTFGNYLGKGMVDRHKGNAIPNIFTAAFIALSIFQSLTSGLGVFLFNGQSRIVEGTAANLIQDEFTKRENEIEALRNPNHPSLVNDKKQCSANTQLLAEMNMKNPGYQSLQVETYGLWKDRRVAPTMRPLWEIQQRPLNEWPVCPRASKKSQELQDQAATLSKELAEMKQQSMVAANQATFLKTIRPQIFDANFRTLGNGDVVMKNGLQAFGQAWDFFWNPPESFRSELTLSYIYMFLSIITSGSACALLIWQSLAKNTKMSFSVPCGQQRSRLLSHLINQLPGEAMEKFRDMEIEARRLGISKATGISRTEISKLNPEFQSLAHLLATGDHEVQQEARYQYWEHLLNLYATHSSRTGDIDYVFIYNKIEAYWSHLESAKWAETNPLYGKTVIQ